MARDMLQRGLTAQEAHCGTDHYAVAVALANLADTHKGLRVPASARDMLQQALTIDEAHCGADDCVVAVTLTSRANMLQRALSIEEAHYGDGHCQVVATLALVSNAHGALGHVATNRDMLQRR